MLRPLAIAALATMALATQADAAGRVSRFATLDALANPFAVSDYSRLSSSTFGLPVFEPIVDEPAASTAPVLMTQPVAIEPAASMATRPPFRPRVRSPFRPPPRPGF